MKTKLVIIVLLVQLIIFLIMLNNVLKQEMQLTIFLIVKKDKLIINVIDVKIYI